MLQSFLNEKLECWFKKPLCLGCQVICTQTFKLKFPVGSSFLILFFFGGWGEEVDLELLFISQPLEMLILQDWTGWGGRKLKSPLQREHPVPAKGTNSALQPLPWVTSEHTVVPKAFFSAPPSFPPLTQRWKDKPSGT